MSTKPSMTPQQAGAIRNTGYLALEHARMRLKEAEGHDKGPWRQAVADAKKTIKEAERYLVRV